MHGEEALYNVAFSVHKMIPKSTILSYAGGQQGMTTIQEHAKGPGPVKGIMPGGNTPSGIAILMALVKHPECLLVHFTDGQGNTDISTADALEIASKEFPKSYIVSIEYPRAMTRRAYANSHIVGLPELADFPDALETALG